MSHTPGPWRVYDRGIGWEVVYGERGEPVNNGDKDTFRHKADALLIAAAPELLAMVKLMRRYLNGDLVAASSVVIAQADSLIAKAEGK